MSFTLLHPRLLLSFLQLCPWAMTALGGLSSQLQLLQWEGQASWESELGLPGALILAGRQTTLQGVCQTDIL